MPRQMLSGLIIDTQQNAVLLDKVGGKNKDGDGDDLVR